MSDTILIEEKFRGPPKSGNGGYVAGKIASALGVRSHEAVEVTLRAPTPLDRPLALRRSTHELKVFDGDTLIAESRAVSFNLAVPAPVSWHEAMAVREQSYSFPLGLNPLFDSSRRGVHPICFCCGAELAPAEGTHVYSAPLPLKGHVAAAWLPHASLADEHENVAPEFIWTALDCPGQMAWRADGIHTGMLGRMTARIEKIVRRDERCVVSGWTMGQEGKKYFAGTALFNESGQLCAYAKAVWIGRFN